MDTLTTEVFKELFATAPERSHAPSGAPEIEFEDGTPRGKAAIEVAHEAIIAQGYSKISTPANEEICYSRLQSGGAVEYRSLCWDEEKRITPGSITEPREESPFPSTLVEGFPIGIQP